MSNLEIWYKRVNETKYHRILEFVDRKNNEPIISWTKDVSNKLQEFDLHLYNPIDESGLPIFPKSGDSIAITDFQNNIFNNTFFGVVMSKDYEPIGVTKNDDTNWIYTLKIQAPNFSTKEITLDYINSVYINDILPIIFNNTPSLGGILSNGIVIPKHNYSGENFLLPPPKFQGEQFDCLVKILDSIAWTFGYYYYAELNSITGLHIVKQLDMFPKNFLKSAPTDWQEGFNFNIYKNGYINNIDYPSLDDSKYVLTEGKVTLSENSYQSKNAIKLKLFIKNSTGEGIKKVITSTGLTDTYNIGGAFEIKSICIKVFDENGIDIRIKTVTSTTVFTVSEMVSSTINFYQQRLLDNGLGTKMRCKIISSSIEYFSNFTINNSIQTITLETAVTGLSVNDIFELVNCYDILRENLNGYPPDVNGYIIKKLDNEQSSITFTEYDRPEAKKEIVIYYYPINQVYKMQVDNDSIEKTGYRGLIETIKDAVTVEQAEEIFNEYLKLMQPLKELNLITSHRKSILDINTNVSVNFGDINQNLIVVEGSGKILSNFGFYRNKPLIIQDKIRLASYKNNIDDILLKIQNQSLAIQNMNLLNDIQDYTNDEDIFEEIGDNALYDLIIPIMLEPTNILVDRFTINFISSNVNSYRVIMSNDIDFTDTFIYNLGIVSNPETLTNADLMINSFTYPIWVKIQAIRGIELSPFSNIKKADNIRSYVIDSNTKVYNDFQDNTFNNSIANNNHFSAINSAHIINTGYITNDSKSVDITSSSNDYLQIDNNAIFNTNEFTYRITFRLKAINAENTIINRFDTYAVNSDAQFYIAYNSSNGLYFGLYDTTYSNTGGFFSKIAFYNTFFNLIVDTEYTLQFAYKESTREFNLCLNGTSLSYTFSAGDFNLSNITLKTSLTARVLVGSAFGLSGQASNSDMIVSRFSYENKYRTSTEALTDYNIISA